MKYEKAHMLSHTIDDLIHCRIAQLIASKKTAKERETAGEESRKALELLLREIP